MEEQISGSQKPKIMTAGVVAGISSLIILFVGGILFYMHFEHWSFVDAFYFVGVTLTTIGYGDIYPKTEIGRIFTVIFAFVGVGTTLLVLSITAEHYFTRRVQQIVKTSADKKIMGITKEFAKKLVHDLIPEPIKPKSMKKKP